MQAYLFTRDVLIRAHIHLNHTLPCLMMQGSSTYTVTGLLLLGPNTLSCRYKKKKKSVSTPKHSHVFWIVKRNIPCLFAHGSSPPRLAHLAGADSAKHFCISLHLHQLGSGCRTEGPWFDLELIKTKFSRFRSFHAADLWFWPNQTHLFGLQGVTASSEIKVVQTNGFKSVKWCRA